MSLFDHIYPRFCLGCGKFGAYYCQTCAQQTLKLQFFKCPECGKPAIDGQTHPKCQKKFGIDGLISFYPYIGLVKLAIKQIKYRFAYRIVHDLLYYIPLEKITALLNIMENKKIFLVPIPLHNTKKQFRGFNQSELIAQELGKRLHLPVCSRLLVRLKKTTPQVDMTNREQRLQNMRGVFGIKRIDQSIKNAVVLLIDDVYTTGATMRSAASAVKRAGAAIVWGITIAQ